MECPKCHLENPQNVKFCVHCGNKLETICQKCGSSNSLAFNFCGECGYDLKVKTEGGTDEGRNDEYRFNGR